MTDKHPAHRVTDTAVSSQRRAVNWRSVLAGLLGVVLICALTPYNDHVLVSTRLVSNYMPVGLLLYFLFLVLAVNAPLRRWFPRRALHAGELAVAMGMVLVGCALPSSGLMDYLPASIVGMHHKAANNRDYAQLLDQVHLPDWLLPDFKNALSQARGNESVIRDYWNRVPLESPTFGNRVRAVPWQLWLRPAAGWALLLAPMYGAVLCLAAILRRQWVENERLPFPIATVYLQIVETPPPDRSLNRLFSSRAFWVAALGVLVVYSLNQLHATLPRHFPEIPLKFNLTRLFVNEPWKYLDSDCKVQAISFAFVGMAFFLQSNVAFSLFAFYLLYQVLQMVLGSYQTSLQQPARYDQMFGAMVVFVLGALWIGRRHWALVMRHMLGRARENDPDDHYLPYRFAGWVFILCLGAMVAWLIAAGASPAGAVVLVLMLMALFLAIARVVAQTGLIYAQIHVPLQRPWILAMDLAAGSYTTAKSFFFSAWFHQMFGHDTRASLPVYATHALRVGDAADDGVQRRGKGVLFLAAMVLALAVGFVTAGASTLFVEYSYATTAQRLPQSPLNGWGIDRSTSICTLNPSVDYIVRKVPPRDSHNRVGHVAGAASLMAVLSYLRLTVNGWPLHPVGYLLAYTDPIARTWFSILLGWLAKTLVVRFGGSRLLSAATPFFIGLVVGECVGGGLWLIVQAIGSPM